MLQFLKIELWYNCLYACNNINNNNDNDDDDDDVNKNVTI